MTIITNRIGLEGIKISFVIHQVTKILFLVLASNLDTGVSGDPIAVERSISVDTGVAGVGTSVAPGDNTVKVSVKVERATRVTLARVDTTLSKTSADHAREDSTKTGVVTVASGSVVDGDDDLQEDIRSGASSGGGAPSRDFSCGSNGAGGALSEKGDGGGVSVPGEGVRQLFSKCFKSLKNISKIHGS